MGLINKLKNVLFEDEEVEIPEPEKNLEKVQKEKPKEAPKKREAVKMTFDADEDEMISDRELFKAEPTFNFPMFDETEFDSVKKEEKVVPPTHEKVQEVKTRVKTPSVLDVEKGRTRHMPVESNYKEARKSRETNSDDKRKFVPSPVISPVYGVLDKNYKKEDIVLPVEEKKTIDVDSVRKKAFGTLEEDIEKTLNTPTREFYSEGMKRAKFEDEKELDDMLEATAEVVIPVSEEPKHDYSTFNIEEEPIESYQDDEDDLEILDRPIKKRAEERLADETLENDLFDLIDSMYESREDGERQ